MYVYILNCYFSLINRHPQQRFRSFLQNASQPNRVETGNLFRGKKLSIWMAKRHLQSMKNLDLLRKMSPKRLGGLVMSPEASRMNRC